jgi:hypothetical protein
VRVAGLLGAVAAASALVATSAQGSGETNALIRPGVGIGKIRLGMTFAQVRRGLGRPMFVNRNVRLPFGGRYVEYVWNYTEWLVGFQTRRGVLRAVRISTISPKERTRDGVGLRSGLRDVLRRYPRADLPTAGSLCAPGVHSAPARPPDHISDRSAGS